MLALKEPTWKSFYFLIILELFILFLSYIAWKSEDFYESKEKGLFKSLKNG